MPGPRVVACSITPTRPNLRSQSPKPPAATGRHICSNHTTKDPPLFGRVPHVRLPFLWGCVFTSTPIKTRGLPFSPLCFQSFACWMKIACVRLYGISSAGGGFRIECSNFGVGFLFCIALWRGQEGAGDFRMLSILACRLSCGPRNVSPCVPRTSQSF